MTASPVSGEVLALRRPVLLLGAIVGAALAAEALAWLFLANRVPSLERFALERNLVGALVFGTLLFIPVLRFARSPGCIFLSGAVAVSILSLAYRVVEGVFPRLAERISVFHVFTLGALVYGLLAAVDWVAQMLLSSRQVPARQVVPRRLP